jgi:hypothetical protein
MAALNRRVVFWMALWTWPGDRGRSSVPSTPSLQVPRAPRTEPPATGHAGPKHPALNRLQSAVPTQKPRAADAKHKHAPLPVDPKGPNQYRGNTSYTQPPRPALRCPNRPHRWHLLAPPEAIDRAGARAPGPWAAMVNAWGMRSAPAPERPPTAPSASRAHRPPRSPGCRSPRVGVDAAPMGNGSALSCRRGRGGWKTPSATSHHSPMRPYWAGGPFCTLSLTILKRGSEIEDRRSG